MSDYPLTPEDLIAGASVVYDVPIPPEILRPGGENGHASTTMIVQLRPLTIGTFQLIMKASRQDASLIPLLMIKESLVQPKLSTGSSSLRRFSARNGVPPVSSRM